VETVDTETFEALVAEALDALPAELGDLMDNVAVLVADSTDRTDMGSLLGLYEGVPLTHRENYGGGGAVLPDRIVLYRETLCGVCNDLDELRRQIGVTVVHEVAHHFGIVDDRLQELGWA